LSLPETLAEVRDLSARYQSGKADAFDAFRNLVSLIFHATILSANGSVRLSFGPGRDLVLGGWRGPTDPLPLTNGTFLRVSMMPYREETEHGPRVKVRSSSYQYQLDADGEQPVFRFVLVYKLREAGSVDIDPGLGLLGSFFVTTYTAQIRVSGG